MLVVECRHRGSGERGNRETESKPEHENGRQHRPRVRRMCIDVRHQGDAGGGDERTGRHREAGTDSRRKTASQRREHEEHERHGRQRCAGRQRGIPDHALQLHRKQEHHPAEREIDRNGRRRHPRESHAAEEAERKHRVAYSLLDDDERGESGHACEPAQEHRGMIPAHPGPLDQREHGAAETHSHGERSPGVEPPRPLIFRFGHPPPRHHACCEREERIDQEDEPPGDRVHEPAPEQRSDDRRETGKPGPRAYRLTAIVRFERALHHGQAGRHQ